MPESSGEKTEEATPKKLREAREKGQVPKSRDLVTIFVMIAFFGTLIGSIPFMGTELKRLMSHAFELIANPALKWSDVLNLGKACLYTLAKVCAPALIAGFVVAGLIGFLQVGAIFTLEPLKPQGKKLNPIEGVKNMFKATTFIELVKNVIKLTLIFFIAYQVVKNSLPDILQTGRLSLSDSAQIAGGIIFKIVLRILILFVGIAIADFLIQRWQFMKQMRMTKDEVRREYKQDEGDPHIKSHRKALHREFAFSDVQQQVKTADAVVTNPTHVAVAIKYDKSEMNAPEIVAKGQRKFAEMIKEIAEKEGVPIMRNVPLAWSLVEFEIGDEVPEELYTAVAEILSVVYRMKRDQASPRQTLEQQPNYA